jgi:hypothetical protein
MCGGRVEVPVLVRKPSRKSATSTRCEVTGCPEAHRNADGYCHNHREAAASALGNATVHGGDALATEKELGRAEMEALAPYLRDSTRLRTLVLSGTKLGVDGVEVLVQALETNTTVTALDLSNNDLKAEGAKVVAELLARCVHGCLFLFLFSVPLVIISSPFRNHTPVQRWATNALNANPTASPTTTPPDIASAPSLTPSPPTSLTTSPPPSSSYDTAFYITDIAFDIVSGDIGFDISDNGAISTVIVNTFPLPIQDIKSKAKLDFSGKGLKGEDAIIIAALIPSNVS